MQVTIGIQNLAREVSIETDITEAQLLEAVTAAVENGTPLVVKSVKGHTTFVPSATIAYVEVGPEEKRSVGFGQL
ncbi:DUF3107 domain-containing protein [Timonella sp. A28]|uniref:DUF3107 domain-containing protein n=1 Tax=Timonella sp. A28 TaxID=3442640 RepID=UPI003EB72045